MVEQMMRAWVQDVYGGPEVVSRRSVPVPDPGTGELQMRVRAVSLNAGDVHVLRGDPYLVRPVFGLKGPRIAVRGMDVAGTVTAVGEGVDAALLGAELVGETPGGGLAEYVVAPADRLVPRPPGLSPSVAAVVPVACGTAAQALALGGVPARGDSARVLVLGASGGVGTYVVQLAVDGGCTVTATCSEGNLALVERLGATALDRRATPTAALPQGAFDVVVEVAGVRPLRALRSLLAPGGTAVLVGGEGGPVLGPLGRILRAQAMSLGRDRKLKALMASPDVGLTSDLLARVVEGRITPVIEQAYGFEEAGRALAHVASGRTVGKVVVDVE